MEVSVFFSGFLIGFSIAAPVGPIGILCIRRTLQGGMWSGFATGLGTAAADAVYGLVAAFGVTAVSSLLLESKGVVRLLGAGFLIWMGIRIFRSQPALPQDSLPSARPWNDFGSAFLLTLSNPLTILSFSGILAGAGVADFPENHGLAALMVGGVFSGSLCWWLLLSGSVSAGRGRFSPVRMRLVNRIAGFILAGFGVAGLTALLY